LSTSYITSAALKATVSLTGQTYADADVAAAIVAASRAIDNLCHRKGTSSRLAFEADTDALQVRYYTPVRDTRIVFDDLATFTGLLTDPSGDGTFPDTWALHTDFELEPLNAATEGEPYTCATVRPNGAFLFPGRIPRSVKLTGKFGWPAVPDAVPQATTILATKLLKRSREAPWGVLGVGVDGVAVRIGKSDAELLALLGPYIKRRIAVA
jgi:hypothetical protein